MEEKKKIGIVACEGADLPEEFTEKYQIEVVRYPVWFQDEEEEIENAKTLYQKMRVEKKLPQTSQPSPMRFKQAYQGALKNFEKILVIVMAKEFSKAVAAAEQARAQMLPEEQKRIEVLDSRLATVAEGLVAWKAQELIDQKKEMPEILETIKGFINQVEIFGFVQDVNWLKRGGRIYGAEAAMALTLQKIGVRPALTIKDGQVVRSGIKCFTRDRVGVILKKLKKVSKEGKIKVAIGHADIPEKDIVRLKDGIKKINGELPLFISQLIPVIGAHTGPGTIIAAYYKE